MLATVVSVTQVMMEYFALVVNHENFSCLHIYFLI